MKMFINFAIFAAVFSILKATEFSEEDIKMFLPFIRRWVPPPCPTNEIYKSCAGKCSDCSQRGRCITQECVEGCDCAPRFFRLTPDGPCEPVANCPTPECGENEVFRECGPICETCSFLECRIISCDHKCYCKEGYLRNKEGTCIPKEDCLRRTRCTHTEQWAESGLVEELCPQRVDEDPNNKTQDIPGCYCKEGYKRNLLGHCINETLCPMIRCLGNEVYHECVPKCNTTCRIYGNPNCTEDDNCYAGCFCPPGYIMNDFRSCIEINKCSLDIQQVKIMDPEVEEEITETTLPPTCIDTDETTIAADSTSTGSNAEFEESTRAEMTSVTTSEQVLTSATPTSDVSVSDLIVKEKSHKKNKATRHRDTKNQNVAKEKETTKYEFTVDEDGSENEDI